MENKSLLLEIKSVTKDYPGVRALDSVDFNVEKGEVHVLVGENGAGKTTLVKVITGSVKPNKLEKMSFEGKPLVINSPRDSLSAGITVVQQHFGLVSEMTVAENIYLGRYSEKGALIDYKAMNAEAQKLIDELELDIKPNWKLSDLTPGEQQIVEILKATSADPELLLMDEPTSGLKYAEIRKLFEVIERLKNQGVTILYISHRLEEVFEIGDRVTVLRNGKKVAEQPLSELDHDEITKLITGKDTTDKYPQREANVGEEILRVEELSNMQTKVPLFDISFTVSEGEIVGVYGILGSGKDELADTLFGLKLKTGGKVYLKGEEVDIESPKKAINCSLGYLTADRHKDGMIEFMTVRQNQTIAALKNYCRGDHILQDEEKKVSDEYIKELSIATPSREARIMNLSGGNQQKVILSRWLISNSELLLLNEPTVGVDVGSKVEVFKLMANEVKKGKAIIHFTSELEEVMGMADRILIMRNGRIVREVVRDELDHSEVLRIATEKSAREELGEIAVN